MRLDGDAPSGVPEKLYSTWNVWARADWFNGTVTKNITNTADTILSDQEIACECRFQDC
jgi:hypothetical protein